MQRREGGKYVECGALNVLLFTNYESRITSHGYSAMSQEPRAINPVYLVHLVYPVFFVTAFRVITWNVEH